MDADPQQPVQPDPGLAALAAKAGLVWVAAEGGAARPLWFAWHADAVHVVVGGGEQPDPFPALPAPVTLTVPSKETGAAVLTAPATAHELAVGSEDWTRAASALAPQRLNGPAGELAHRWATSSRLVRIAPDGPAAPTGDDGGSAGRVSVEPVRPRGWRRMRAHARRRPAPGPAPEDARARSTDG